MVARFCHVQGLCVFWANNPLAKKVGLGKRIQDPEESQLFGFFKKNVALMQKFKSQQCKEEYLTKNKQNLTQLSATIGLSSGNSGYKEGSVCNTEQRGIKGKLFASIRF